MGVNCLIFGVTGNVLQSDHDHFMNCGADFVLTKPLSVEKLSETLKTFRCVSLGDRIL
jgi:CheY-like chemotaxis protein